MQKNITYNSAEKTDEYSGNLQNLISSLIKEMEEEIIETSIRHRE